MPGRQKSDAKREEILAAASAEFAHRLFHEVLMDDVSTRAGVGKGTLYRYFPTKDELFIATVFRGLDQFHDQFLRMFDARAPLEQILSQAVSRMLSYFSGRAEFLTLIQRYEHRLPKEDSETWRQRRAEAVRAISDAIAREARAGSLRPVDATLCAELLLGMVRTAIQSSLAEQRDPERVAREIVALFMNGVLKHPAGVRRAPLPAVRVARGGGA